MNKAASIVSLLLATGAALCVPAWTFASGSWTDVVWTVHGAQAGDIYYSADGYCYADTGPHTNIYVDVYDGEIGAATVQSGSFHVAAGTYACGPSLTPGHVYYAAIIDSASVLAFRNYMATGGAPPTSNYSMVKLVQGPFGGIDWNAISFPVVYSSTTQAFSASSSLWSNLSATDTLAAMNGSCSQAGNIFAEGLCTAGVFLFVPNSAVVSAFSDLASTTIPSKFPFSWVYAVRGTFGGLAASSTSNMIVLTFPYHSLGVGSTSPLGLANIAPDVVVFGTSTIEKYIDPGTWATFQTLIGLAFILTLLADIFFTVRGRGDIHDKV